MTHDQLVPTAHVSAPTSFGPLSPSAVSPSRDELEMLRRVARRMVVTQDLPAVFSSIASALVEHTSASTALLHLFLRKEECEICRAHGQSANSPFRPSPGEPALHLMGAAGDTNTVVGAHHLISLQGPAGFVARTREPALLQDVPSNPLFDNPPELRAMMQQRGIRAAAGYPLIFHGELLGTLGMQSRREIAQEEFELLGIFADQAAMAIKSAYLLREVERAREHLAIENAYLVEAIKEERGFEGIIGASAALKGVLRKVKQVAAVETTVLLTGETGTGKELVARAIHEGSPRAQRPLIKVNCGAIPQGVVESELFGHEKGAFTGALQRRIGRFELADEGTLFMDEVGELPVETQVKLLRVLQEQEVERVGSTRALQVDVRVVAATNRDLEAEVGPGRFRADLYYRLNVFPIHVPPLRERAGDIPLLVGHFLAQLQRKLAKPLQGVTGASMRVLQEYGWPGNIRELQNVLERACVLATTPVVEIEGLLRAGPGVAPGPGPGVSGGRVGAAVGVDGGLVSLDENERAHIRRALVACGGRINGAKGAAAVLGINPNTLRSRMKKLGIGKNESPTS